MTRDAGDVDVADLRRDTVRSTRNEDVDARAEADEPHAIALLHVIADLAVR